MKLRFLIQIFMTASLCCFLACGNKSSEDQKENAQSEEETPKTEQGQSSSGTDIGNPNLQTLAEIPQDIPENSSQTASSISLNFSSSLGGEKISSDKLSLVASTEGSEPLKLNSQISIIDARLGISAIRLGVKKLPPKKLVEAYHKIRGAEIDLYQKLVTKATQLKKPSSKPSDTPIRKFNKRPDAIYQKEKLDEVIHKNAIDLQNWQKNVLNRLLKADPATKVKGPFLLNALHNDITPPLNEFKVMDGTYHRVDFMLAPVLEKGDNPFAQGQSLYIEGTFINDQGDEEYFQVSSPLLGIMNIISHEGFQVNSTETNSFQVDVDLENWFKEINFKALKKKGGLIRITPLINIEAFKQIMANIRLSLVFGTDQNDNGAISSNEKLGQSPLNEEEGAINYEVQIPTP